MDLNALRAFLEVAEQASFSRAAEQLHLTQPAVSKRIAALEETLGTPLFDRIARHIVPTQAGRALMPRAREILRQVDDCRRAVADLSGEVAGPLVVGTSHHIGLRRLPPVLKAFTQHYPKADLDIRFMASESICEAVEEGRLEVGIVTLPLEPPATLTVTPLWDDPLYLVFAPDHPLARKDALTPATIARYPAILPDPGTFTRQLIDQAFERHGQKLIAKVETNYMETIRMMVSIGLGWSLLPATLQGEDLITHDLASIQTRRTLGLVTHRNRTLSNVAKRLSELLYDHSAL